MKSLPCQTGKILSIRYTVNIAK